MNDIHDDRQSVYEIGYLVVSSVPEEGVPAEADKVKKIVIDNGGSMIADEAPHKETLAYEMRRKTVSGSYENYNEAYFGWVKFEMNSSKINDAKKAIETLPSVLRMLTISTIRENTYLGKRAAEVVASMSPKRVPSEMPVTAPVEKKDVAPASIEEMDKSIDEMVKEV